MIALILAHSILTPRPRLLRRTLQSLFVLVSTLLAGCSTMGGLADSVFLMSTAEEAEMAQKMRPELEKELTLVKDPQLQAYITRVGNKVWANSSPTSEFQPTFQIVKDDEINAFAVLGGFMYVNTGMIEAADDEAELAAVMAHEAGHAILRHGAKNVSRNQGMSVVQQIVLGSDAGQIAELATSVIASGALSNYSRSFEREADTLGVNTLWRAGYDPMAMRTFFSKLVSKYGNSSGGLTAFFASHPATQERMDAVTLQVKSLPPKPYSRPVEELRAAQARL